MSDLKGLVDDLYIQAEHAKTADDMPDKYAEMQEQLANQLAQFIDDEEKTESCTRATKAVAIGRMGC